MNSEHLDLMLDAALTKACEKLEKGDVLHPYVLTMDKNTFIEFSEDFPDDVYESDPEELIEDLYIRLKKKVDTDKILGSVLVCQVKVKPPGTSTYCSAVEAHVEYFDGSSYDCFLPYNKNESQVNYGEIFSSECDPKVFVKNK
jgi:hypothetical protein